jgi:hypothetical protein
MVPRTLDDHIVGLLTASSAWPAAPAPCWRLGSSVDDNEINLTVADKLESRNSTITTESTQADGGDITNTGFLTWLINSSITATVGGGPQTTGGNIRINSPYVVLKDSHVIANAYEGKGGNIDITADTYLADWTSTVSASSALGISGQVDINSPLVNLSGLLSPLPTTFADITELLADDCETRYKYRKVSSLVVGWWKCAHRGTIWTDKTFPLLFLGFLC